MEGSHLQNETSSYLDRSNRLFFFEWFLYGASRLKQQ